MAIPTITEGMKWGDVFAVINQLIAVVNGLQSVFGKELASGAIDYNVLTNRPRINGVELVGSLLQKDLRLDIDSATRDRMLRVEDRMALADKSISAIDKATNSLDEFRDDAYFRFGEQSERFESLKDDTDARISGFEAEVNASVQRNYETMQNIITRQNVDSAEVERVKEQVEDLPESATIQDIVSRVNQVIHRLNDTASVALCGSARPGVCPSPISDLVINERQ